MPSSSDYYNQYKPGKDPNRNKESGLAYGLPYWLRSTQGGYAGVGGDNGLMALLQNPGQTDSLMLNRNLAANSRGTMASQDQARASTARSGFGGSGLAAALQAAIGQAGQNQQGQIYADESRRREDLRRMDLQSLYQFFVQPKLDMYGTRKGAEVAREAAAAQKKGALYGALGTAAAGAAGMVPG